MRLIAKGDLGTERFDYIIDGKRFFLTLSHTRMIAQAHWEDKTLVVEGEDVEPQRDVWETKWIMNYSISDDDQLLTIRRGNRVSGSSAGQEEFTYEKQE